MNSTEWHCKLGGGGMVPTPILALSHGDRRKVHLAKSCEVFVTAPDHVEYGAMLPLDDPKFGEVDSRNH